MIVKSAPRVSVIIVNYNGGDLLRECLESVRSQTLRDLEVIVVDNSSRDGSPDEVRRAYPDVRLIALRENTGFAGGNRAGYREAQGTYLLLLNNDVVLDKSCLENLLLAMEEHPDAGICASKIIRHGEEVIDSAGDGFSTGLKGFNHGRGLSPDRYDTGDYIFGACAGAALYRRSMIEEIGFFDEDFFLIYEDTDLNLRAQLAGWRTWYVPSAIVHHRVRSSIGKMSDTAVFYSLRNCELVRVKNLPLGLIIRCFFPFLMTAFLEFIYFAVKHRRPALYIRAKLSAARLLPKMIMKRREVRRTMKVNNPYLLSIMTPVSERGYFVGKLAKFMRE